jgi:uncharacterized protein DUF4136
MKHLQRWTLALSLVFLLSSLAVAQKVKTEELPNFDFSQLHTFFVKIGTSWGNPITESQVKDMVAQTLTQKGWTAATSEDSADAEVVVHGATQQKHSLDTMYSGGMGGWGWGGMGTATTTTTSYTVGTLLIDIFDAKEHKLVYRGTAQDELSDKTEKNVKKVQKALDKMFKDFPPKPKEGKN